MAMKREQVSALRHLFYGHAAVPAKGDLANAWKAVKVVATGAGVLREPQRLCLLGRMAALGTPADVIAEVEAYEGRADGLLARLGRTPELRQRTGAWILYEGLSVAMSGGEPSRGVLAAARAIATGTDTAIETLEALTEICREEAALRRRRIDVLAAGGIRFDQL
jgi:hypothetical protein